MHHADAALSPPEVQALGLRGYVILGKLNEGSYSKVYLTQYNNPSKNYDMSHLACKIIDTSVAPKDFVKKFLPREIEMLLRLKHPHIVYTHSIYTMKSKYFIFMRHVELGDMLDYVLRNGPIPEDQARIWIRQLALAIQYMHEMDVAHRDIKCENILISNNLNVKLSDFGFTRSCVDKDLTPIYSDTFCGSLSYTAPEILTGQPYAPKPTDLWSLGVVMFVMINRAMPFDDKVVKQLILAQMSRKWKFRNAVFDELSSQCKRIVTDMLEPNALVRIKIEKVVNNEWIAMDSRLLILTNQERKALKRAHEEKRSILKNKSKPQALDEPGTSRQEGFSLRDIRSRTTM